MDPESTTLFHNVVVYVSDAKKSRGAFYIKTKRRFDLMTFGMPLTLGTRRNATDPDRRGGPGEAAVLYLRLRWLLTAPSSDLPVRLGTCAAHLLPFAYSSRPVRNNDMKERNGPLSAAGVRLLL